MPKTSGSKLRKVEQLVLVSTSPRRREILAGFVPKLKVIPPKCAERPVRSPTDLRANSVAKLKSVKLPSVSLALAADTAVFLDSKVMGKPLNVAAARRMLRELSGKWHAVYTAMAVSIDSSIEVATARAEVRFRKLSEAIIEAYVSTGEPLDKAGAYGIQGLGGLLVEEIRGDYYNVVGLPIQRLEEMLEARGYTLLLARI